MTFTWAGLPATEQTFDRQRQRARDDATDRTAQALRDLALDRLLDPGQLRALATTCVDAALAMPAEQADLFGTNGRLVARQWDAIDQLRGELQRRALPTEGADRS